MIGDIPILQEIDDPNVPGWKALLTVIYLVRHQQWKDFDDPETIRWIQQIEAGKNEPWAL